MIYSQLKQYCPCVEDLTTDDVDEMVNVISLATCWQRVPCETFLKGVRREVIDLPSCADCPVVFEPYYHPFDVTTFKFSLVKIEGIEETVTDITEFKYSSLSSLQPTGHEDPTQTHGYFRLDPGLPSCKCGCNPCCGCPPEYKLLVEYEAGYEAIPECLLPVFCHVMEVIKKRRECECCHDCGCDNGSTDEQYPTGDVLSQALDVEISRILMQTYKNQLGMISLCRGRKYLWGVVA